jgi:hypothetical protein
LLGPSLRKKLAANQAIDLREDPANVFDAGLHRLKQNTPPDAANAHLGPG